VIQSVDRAIQLMLALQGTRRLGVTELAERLGLAKGTVHGLLRTLKARAVVEQDPETGKYMLGPALLRLGNVYLENQELRSRSLRWTDALAQRTESAVRVGVLVVPDVLVVHHAFRPEGGTQFLEVGIGIPAHASCMGKAILAFRPADLDRLLEEPLRRLTGTTEVDPDALRSELAEVRTAAIAFEREEAVLGEWGVAGTIFGASGRAIGAVAVVLAGSQVRDDLDEVTVEAVRDTARAISRELGAASWPAETAL
jgi:DNA-binding IclR family transcriptional regulator